MRIAFFLLWIMTTAALMYSEKKYGLYSTMLFSLCAMLFLAFFVGIWVISNKAFYRFVLKGAPFVRTKKQDIDSILKHLSTLQNKPQIAELGSGDGNIAIELAKARYRVIGFEINPILVLISRLRIKLFKLENYVQIEHKNFWKQDFSSFDVIILFGIPYIMNDLENKITSECKADTKVISNKFSIPLLKLEKTYGDVLVYSTK